MRSTNHQLQLLLISGHSQWSKVTMSKHLNKGVRSHPAAGLRSPAVEKPTSIARWSLKTMQLVLCALLLLPIALACNPPPTPLDCTAPAKLCGGLRRIQQASCAQLQSEPFLVSVVLGMGLARHPRNESLYGPGMGKHMSTSRQGGLGQQPVQIASALMFLSKQQISTYVEARTRRSQFLSNTGPTWPQSPFRSTARR